MKLNNTFKFENNFNRYLFNYVRNIFIFTFIIFVTFYYFYGLNFASLITYIFIVLEIFIMVIDVRLKYEIYNLYKEIKNLKNALRGLK